MISALKSTLSPINLKILRPKVMKNLTKLPNKFCESPPRFASNKCFHYFTQAVLIKITCLTIFQMNKFYYVEDF